LQGSLLVVCEAADKNLLLASRNLPKVEVTTGSNLNTYQVLRYDKLLFTRPAFEQVEQRLK
ncbi:MAG TPA: 50S ribosomal protein L4, partial [Candidatus Paceibacterota bacterium]|nr:50S ribosomal protein L4 [Candidatus Paceibacterota bacterium]